MHIQGGHIQQGGLHGKFNIYLLQVWIVVKNLIFFFRIWKAHPLFPGLTKVKAMLGDRLQS